MKSTEDIKKALSICKAWTGCQYETHSDCPYRITACSCDLAGLIADAGKLVTRLETENAMYESMIDKVAKAIDRDCDNCDRW